MDLTSLLVLVLVIFIGFLALYLFFKQDLADLRRSLDTTKETVSASLLKNNQDISSRLLHATEVIAELQKETGAFSEIGRSMRDLQDYLRSPKLRGNLGETVLVDLIGQLFPKSSYRLQHAFRSGDKVDVAIKTGAGLLPIDAKFPLENFQKMAKASEEERPLFRRALIRDLRAHIKAISSKYLLPQEGTLDFALMYIPSEAVYYELVCLEEVMNYARDQRVYPVSPTTIYAALQTILLSYEGQKIETRSKEVLELLRAIHKDYAKTTELMSTLGSHLTNAHNKFADLDHQFDSLGQKLASTKKLSADSNPKLT